MAINLLLFVDFFCTFFLLANPHGDVENSCCSTTRTLRTFDKPVFFLPARLFCRRPSHMDLLQIPLNIPILRWIPSFWCNTPTKIAVESLPLWLKSQRWSFWGRNPLSFLWKTWNFNGFFWENVPHMGESDRMLLMNRFLMAFSWTPYDPMVPKISGTWSLPWILHSGIVGFKTPK